MVKKTSIAAVSEAGVGMYGASSRVWFSRPAIHDSGTVHQLGSGIVSSLGHVVTTTAADVFCISLHIYDFLQPQFRTFLHVTSNIQYRVVLCADRPVWAMCIASTSQGVGNVSWYYTGTCETKRSLDNTGLVANVNHEIVVSVRVYM